MNITPTVIPPNTNPLNDYAEFDRGLFKYRTPQGVDKIARIAKATWTSQGDNSSPGVLSYQIETFRKLIASKEELEFYSEGIQPTVYTCITRSDISSPNVLEAFAIRELLRGNLSVSEDVIFETHRVSKKMLGVVTDGLILDMLLTYQFEKNGYRPLKFVSGTIKYTAVVNDTPTDFIETLTNPIIGSTRYVMKKIKSLMIQ